MNILEIYNQNSQQFASELMKHQSKIEKIYNELEEYIKALFSIRNTLQRVLKNPENMNQAIFDCIDIARSVTPYSKNYGETFSVDPPLTDEEKEAFLNKLKEE